MFNTLSSIPEGYSSIIKIALHNNLSPMVFNRFRLKDISELMGLSPYEALSPTGVIYLYNHKAWAHLYPGIKIPNDSSEMD